MSYSAPSGNQLAFLIGKTGAYTAPRGDQLFFTLRDPVTGPGAVIAAGESYTCANISQLTIAAPGVLANDTGSGLTVTVAVPPQHGALSLAQDGSFVYTPVSSYIGADSFWYTISNAQGADSAQVLINVIALPPVVHYVRADAGARWSQAAPVNEAISGAWSIRNRAVARVSTAWQRAPRAPAATRIAWGRETRLESATAAAWGFAARRAHESRALWQSVTRFMAQAALDWRQRQRAPSGNIAVRWVGRPRAGRETAAGTQLRPRAMQQPSLPWGNRPRAPTRVWMPWGYAPRVPWRPHSPGIDVPPVVPPAPYYVPPRGDQLALPLQCLYQPPSGDQLYLPIGPFACYAASLGRRRYIVLNSAAVVRLPERTPIPVSAITIGASVDDVTWSIGITLADPAFKAFLLPDASGPKSIEINVNGYVWTAIVESWSTTTKFPGDVVTMSGHSRAMLLNAPYRTPRDYVQPAQRTAQQLMADELQFSGFSLDYGAVDWLVPGGVWTYQQQTPIAAIQTIAAAAGAIVQSHPFNDVLQIRPRWPVSPWNWTSMAPDKTVQDDFTPQLTAVDQTNGMASYQITGLPLWPATAQDMPGLILPLHLVQFVAAAGWKGQVASVQINVQVQTSGSGAAALIVTQDIKLQAPQAEPIYDYVLVSGQQVGVSAPVIRQGRAGNTRLPQIVDTLITDATVQLERGRNAIAGGGDNIARTNFWRALTGTLPGNRYIKGNVTAINSDGSVTVATTDGGTIRARPLPGQNWTIGAGVFVQDGRIVDVAPALPGVTQYV